jgi:hypothetical protein
MVFQYKIRRIRIEPFSSVCLCEEHYLEAGRTTIHPPTKIAATLQKGPQNRRHPTCKVARALRSHDFYDVNVALFRLS